MKWLRITSIIATVAIVLGVILYRPYDVPYSESMADLNYTDPCVEDTDDPYDPSRTPME